VVAHDVGAWRSWNVLGTEYDKRHEWDRAEDAYANAMTGGSPLVLNNRGYSRLSQGKCEEAITDFVSALKIKPDFKAARLNLRLAIAMKGDYSRATEGADSNDRAILLNNAGFAAMMRGDYAQAKDLLNQAIQARGKYYAMASFNLQAEQALEKGSD
jgi:Flp pilus assembly protein TadD